MILVDTSIWIDHLHGSDTDLMRLLEQGEVATHPMIIGELALGSLGDRNAILGLLAGLRSVTVATHDEVLAFLENRRLYGRGLSLIDAHLLASALLTSSCALWTRDKRLSEVAHDFRVDSSPSEGSVP
jgi:predicted nucleic acid-binding protein